MHYQLKTQQLACQRGDNILFERLNLSIQSGDLVHIEGPNGIGKSSLLRILVGLSQPLAGVVTWNGQAITQQREDYHCALLYLGHQAGIKPKLSPWENLAFYQKISACEQGKEALWSALDKQGGMVIFTSHQNIPSQQVQVISLAQYKPVEK